MKFFLAEDMKVRDISDWVAQPLIPDGLFQKELVTYNYIEHAKLTKKLRYKILRRDGFRCVVCGTVERLEIDHILPVTKGGLTEERNLRTLCFWCNRLKGDKINAAQNSVHPTNELDTTGL